MQFKDIQNGQHFFNTDGDFCIRVIPLYPNHNVYNKTEDCYDQLSDLDTVCLAGINEEQISKLKENCKNRAPRN